MIKVWRFIMVFNCKECGKDFDFKSIRAFVQWHIYIYM